MSTRLTYFVGGVRHGEWLNLDTRMSHVEMPRVDRPSYHSADLDDSWGGLTISRDLYRIEQVVVTLEHLCVRHAGYARVYRCAIWDGMPPGATPPMRELLDRGEVESEHRGSLATGQAPDWWLWPTAGFRAMIG